MKYCVYVLKSRKTGYRYVGQTNNLARRLKEHEAGVTSSIRFQLPFDPLHIEHFETRKEAMRRERFLKSGKGREWLDKNIGPSGCGAVG